ncbi:MAG: glycosyl transferase family protein [Chloroflexi bacterium OLB14]|nr:MAG: glycosyl transferase family protein [Chloroflexi bacterium OLB14]
MLLGIPIFDTSLVILSRLKRKQPISTGRRDHTYHRFIAMGLRPQYAVGIVHLATLIVSSLAFASLYLPLALALILFIISISIGIILLLWLEPQKTLDDQTN